MNLAGSFDPDWPIRIAAFRKLAELTRTHGDVLPWAAIEGGFVLADRRFRFANQTKGIFRPAGMSGAALSIKTTVPRQGPRKYDDLGGDGAFSYALQRRDVDYHDNKLLVRAAELATPLVYFYGIEPGMYRPIWPAYVARIDRDAHAAIVVAGDPDETRPPGEQIADGLMTQVVRRYTTIEVKKRIHQDAFRHLVITAYQTRCAVCRLPNAKLLDAAHIVHDRDVRGEPRVSNGLALCKLHHAAYDAELLGIRPDYVIEISPVLWDADDGPTLEHGIKGFAGEKIRLPRRPHDHPARQNLEERYAVFRRGA